MYIPVNILHQWNISWRTDMAVLGLNYNLRYTNQSLLVGAFISAIIFCAFQQHIIKQFSGFFSLYYNEKCVGQHLFAQ